MIMASLVFELSFPSFNTWNGKTIFNDHYHAALRPIRRGIDAMQKASQIVSFGPYRYDFGDGWVASLSARIVDAREARSIRARSIGFMGYEWMIESILSSGRIAANQAAGAHA